MSSTVSAGQAMGPRPGLAIVSFWQGIISVGLRIAVVVLGALMLISTCYSVETINSIDSEFRDTVINKHKHDREINSVNGIDFPNTPGIVGGSKAACGWVILLCLLAFIYEPLVIVLRCLNFGVINLYIKIMLGIDMFLSSLFALGFLVGVISEGGWAIGWWKWQEFIDDLEDETSRDLVDALNLYFDRIFGAMCISASFSIIATFVFAALLLWMFLFHSYKWNEKVVKYAV